jgi:DedD protein
MAEDEFTKRLQAEAEKQRKAEAAAVEKERQRDAANRAAVEKAFSDRKAREEKAQIERESKQWAAQVEQAARAGKIQENLTRRQEIKAVKEAEKKRLDEQARRDREDAGRSGSKGPA